MSNIEVSVIVPVYNVERYLDKCINSILSQTYNGYEIILVDDGSTDSSGEICDRYAKDNECIRVIHKENGGLSDARNIGCANCIGNFILFIDSDDFIDYHCIEKLINVQHFTNADVVIARHVDVYDSKGIEDIPKGTGKLELYRNYEAIAEMCYEIKFGTSACAKLFRSSLVKRYQFPIGRYYEDLATIYKFLGDADKIVFLDEVLYYYVQRFGSIRNKKWNYKCFDVILSTNELIDYVFIRFPVIINDAVQRYFFSANEVYVRAFDERSYLKIIKDIRHKMKRYWPYVLENRKISIKQKLRYWMMMDFPILYKHIWKIKHIV